MLSGGIKWKHWPEMGSIMSLKQRLVKFRLKSNVEKQLPMVFYEKKVFLKTSENSQENTCGRVSF